MATTRLWMLAVLSVVVLGASVAPGLAASDQNPNGEMSAQRRAKITIYPQNRPFGPNARRECQAWLEKEYRVSGPVIVPRQRCWWH
jgi:hypothetical protein